MKRIDSIRGIQICPTASRRITESSVERNQGLSYALGVTVMHFKMPSNETFTTRNTHQPNEWRNPIEEEAGSCKHKVRPRFEGRIARDSRTQAGARQNRVAAQVRTQAQAYQGGSLGVGMLVGVLAYRGAPYRNRQGDLTAN